MHINHTGKFGQYISTKFKEEKILNGFCHKLLKMWQKHNRNVVAGALVGGTATDVQNCETNQHRLK